MNIKYPNISQFDCTLGICQISESYTQYCRKFYYTGFYLLLLCISSLSLNFAVFVAYLKKKKSSIDIQIMVILVSNLVAAVFCLPSLIYSNLHCNWQIPKFVCLLSGGTMYFNGCLCILTMTTISIDR